MRYAVDKTCIHPDFKDERYGNDIMLLKVITYPFASGMMQDTKHAMNWSLLFVSPAV